MTSWYGTDPTGQLDSSPGVANAIADQIAGNRGATVQVPPGDYLLRSMVRIANVQGLRFVGSGLATRFLWGGNPTDPMFRLENCRESLTADFQVQVAPGNPLAIGVQVMTTATRTVVSTDNRFSGLWLQGVNGYMGRGFLLGGVDTTTGLQSADANNDFPSFEDCYAVNYAHAGWTINNSQVYGVRMDRCKAETQIALPDTYGVWTDGGYFTWTGGFMGGHGGADVGVGRAGSQPFVVQDAVFEGSARWVDSPLGYSGAATTLVLARNRFAANGVGPLTVRWPRAGRLVVRDNTIGNGNVGGANPIRFQAGLSDPAKRTWGRFDFVGNTVYVPAGQTAGAIFGTLPPTQCRDNAYLTVDGSGSGD